MAASPSIATALTSAAAAAGAINTAYALPTLEGYVADNAPEGHSRDLVLLLGAVSTGVKAIASKVARAGLEGLYGLAATDGPRGSGDKQKKLDVVANEILKAQLAGTSVVGVLASEEDDEAIEARPLCVQGSGSGRYVVVFDPLDGSRNIDAAIPTGTIFGIYERPPSASVQEAALQPGSRQVAAGYALYSSATMLVLTLGNGVAGFTLDPLVGEWLLSHPSIQVPARGQIYSVNDARYHDWPPGLQRYIDDIRQGKGQVPKQYSARYICSLVADFHRTLLYGGVAMNPREHLRLVYEANPMALLAEQAGGSGSDGVRRVLDIPPARLHQRLPLFLGSAEDIAELESYGDVQQLSGKTYDV